MNFEFLKGYCQKNSINADDSLLEYMANNFSAWEKKYVYCFKNGYEDFRDKVIWMDYDEMLEMYMEEVAHPSVKPHWQSNANYTYFKNNILPQLAGKTTSSQL